MDVSTTYALANIMGGALVLSSYFVFLPMTSMDLLWANISLKNQYLFWVSICITAISFLVAFVTMYASLKNKHRKSLSVTFWIGLAMFFIGSSLWAPMVWRRGSISVFIALLMASAGAFLMAMESKPNMLAVILFTIVFLHCVIMDNMIWFQSYHKVLSS